jgi:hypothetical protein
MSRYTESLTPSKPFDWRSHIEIHPAAEWLPPQSEVERATEENASADAIRFASGERWP